MMERDDFSKHGIAVSLGESFSLGPVRQPGRSSAYSNSATAAAIPINYVSKLPPAVANIPKEHIRDYGHGKMVYNYLIGKELGEGSFAKVKEALHAVTGEKVAVKVIDKRKASQDSYVSKNFKREAKLLQMVHHPNIIQLYEIIETEHSYYLITELCSGGELMKHIYKKGRLEENETRKYIRQIVSAVDHLHKSGIIHRDLKVENLMLDSNMDIKLIDFGLSNEEYILIGEDKVHCATQCGSPAYAAPELLGHKPYGPEVDIWSIGVNMYAMLTGSLPYTVDPFNITALHARILENKMNPIPESISEDCKHLLHELLTPNPEDRIKMSQIFKDSWLNQGHKLPFTPAPFPSHLTANDLNEDVIEHMVYSLRVKEAQNEITQELLSNRVTSTTAIYHLLCARLKRYNKDFQPSSARPKRQHRKFMKQDDEPLQGQKTDEVSSIIASRRHTLPPSDLEGALAPFQNDARSVHASSSVKSKTRTGPRYGWNAKQEVQLAPVRPPISLKRNSHPVMTAGHQMDFNNSVAPPESKTFLSPVPVLPAGQSNSRSSRMRNSFKYKSESSGHSRDSSDDFTFHPVDTNALSDPRSTLDTSFESTQETSLPQIPKQTLIDVKRKSSKLRKGMVELTTEMTVDEILSEIFRVGDNLRMQSLEHNTHNTMKWLYKDITFTVTVNKEAPNQCRLNFQWLSGGDHASYIDTCEEMVRKLHL